MAAAAAPGQAPLSALRSGGWRIAPDLAGSGYLRSRCPAAGTIRNPHSTPHARVRDRPQKADQVEIGCVGGAFGHQEEAT